MKRADTHGSGNLLVRSQPPMLAPFQPQLRAPLESAVKRFRQAW